MIGRLLLIGKEPEEKVLRASSPAPSVQIAVFRDA